MSREARDSPKFEPALVCDIIAEVSESQVIPVRTVKDVLRGIESRYRDSISTLVGYADLLQTRESEACLSGMILAGIEAADLQSRRTKSCGSSLTVSKPFDNFAELINHRRLAFLDGGIRHHPTEVDPVTIPGVRSLKTGEQAFYAFIANLRAQIGDLLSQSLYGKTVIAVTSIEQHLGLAASNSSKVPRIAASSNGNGLVS